MEAACRLRVYGVRGSFPRAEAEFLAYGGNTSCFSLEWPGGLAALDAGTGLVKLGETLADRKTLHILIGHLHLDHLLGLTVLPQLYDAGGEVFLYGPAGLERGVRTLLGPPYWPLGVGELPARVHFRELAAGERFSLPEAAVETMDSSHPGGGLLYRLEAGGRRVVYGLDWETDAVAFARLADFARGADLLIWDADYAPEDTHPGWGHSTWAQGLALAQAAEVRQVLMSHYDRKYTDEFLVKQEALAQAAWRSCRFAREGMKIEL